MSFSNDCKGMLPESEGFSFPIQVKVQTQPGWARGLADGLPKLYAAEGMTG